MGQKPKKNEKLPKKGIPVVNCAFLRSKTQILRDLWNFLRDSTVAPFRNSDYRCRHTWYGRKDVLPRIMISYSYTLSSRIKWHIYRMNCPVIATFLGHGIRMKRRKNLKLIVDSCLSIHFWRMIMWMYKTLMITLFEPNCLM